MTAQRSPRDRPVSTTDERTRLAELVRGTAICAGSTSAEPVRVGRRTSSGTQPGREVREDRPASAHRSPFCGGLVR